jgi:hypothetical protein
VVLFPTGAVIFFFFFATASRPALGPTQPRMQLVRKTLSRGVKQPGREADHPPLSGIEVKNAWSYTFTPVSVHSVVLG